MGDKIKVVMIDDEIDLCELVKANLEETGQFEVVVTNKAPAAEEVVLQEKPDIVLLDNVMPERKGQDIAKALKQKEETAKIPIIVVSGKGEMVYNKKRDQFQWLPANPMAKQRGEIIDERNPEKAAQAYGVEDYISKPFTTDLLITVIRDVLKKAKKRKDADDEGPVI